MVLEKRITSHKAERLLRLHNELDDLVAGSGPRRTLRSAGIAVVVSVIGFRILQLTLDVGVGFELGLIFTIGIITVLLGDGIPLFPSPALKTSLRLIDHRVYSKSGIVTLEYSIMRPGA